MNNFDFEFQVVFVTLHIINFMNDARSNIFIQLRFHNCSIYELIIFCVLDHLFRYVTRFSFSRVIALSSLAFTFFLLSLARALCYSRKFTDFLRRSRVS